MRESILGDRVLLRFRGLAHRNRRRPTGHTPGPAQKVDVRKPNFFIVGAPRCGTTSLWAYLKVHPEIFMPAQKELYFFDADLDLWGGETRPSSLDQYLEFFSAAGDQKKIGEATPSYLRSQRAPKEIKVFSPEAQIIIMLRNPVDVMHSLHSTGRRYNTEPLADFRAALEADASRTGRELIGYREFTRFPSQVQRCFDLFGRENVHAIIYDDLKEDSAGVYRSTLRFLGVSPGFTPAFGVVDANRHVRNFGLQRILVRPPRGLREIGRSLAPRWLGVRIRRDLLNLNTVVRPRPPMDPELRRRLQKEFEPEVERLSKLVGRDLSGWCKEVSGESAHKSDREQEGS